MINDITIYQPIKRKVIIDDKRISNRCISSGYIGFFCKHCFEPIIEKVNDFVEHYRGTFKHIEYMQQYNVICPRCGYISKWFEYLDANMTKPVAMLNLKGYPTIGCCEGHDKDDIAYIAFKHDIFNETTSWIPKMWTCKTFQHFDHTDGNKYIYINSVTIDCECKNHSLKNRIESIWEWIKQLPCKGNDNGE